MKKTPAAVAPTLDARIVALEAVTTLDLEQHSGLGEVQGHVMRLDELATGILERIEKLEAVPPEPSGRLTHRNAMAPWFTPGQNRALEALAERSGYHGYEAVQRLASTALYLLGLDPAGFDAFDTTFSAIHGKDPDAWPSDTTGAFNVLHDGALAAEEALVALERAARRAATRSEPDGTSTAGTFLGTFLGAALGDTTSTRAPGLVHALAIATQRLGVDERAALDQLAGAALFIFGMDPSGLVSSGKTFERLFGRERGKHHDLERVWQGLVEYSDENRLTMNANEIDERGDDRDARSALRLEAPTTCAPGEYRLVRTVDALRLEPAIGHPSGEIVAEARVEAPAGHGDDVGDDLGAVQVRRPGEEKWSGHDPMAPLLVAAFAADHVGLAGTDPLGGGA